MACSNAEKDTETERLRCMATGYMCRYVSSDPRKLRCPCLFDQIFSKCKQMQRMLESIRAAQVGSEITMLFKQRHGFYTKEAIDSSKGKIIQIDEYGRMKAEIDKLKGIWTFNPEDFTRYIFLRKEDFEKRSIELEEMLEEHERMKEERREDDGWSDAKGNTEFM